MACRICCQDVPKNEQAAYGDCCETCWAVRQAKGALRPYRTPFQDDGSPEGANGSALLYERRPPS